VEKTMSGTVIGTYKYMAPEVYNNQPYGTSADIYSLGLVLYWLLNERRMPFMPLPPEKLKHGMEEESRNRRFSGEPLPPPAHGSEKLKKIVLKACAYNPADRYSSAAEMLQDLNGNDNSVVVPLVTKAIVEEKPEEVLYTIRFRDEDGVLLSSKNYKEGEKIELPTIMERQIDGKTYEFKEWSPAINERAKKSVEYRAVYKEKVEAPVILPAADKKVTSISQPRNSSNKKWIAAALALLTIVIFAFISFSDNEITSVRIDDYYFEGEQLDILRRWAKTIEPIDYTDTTADESPEIFFEGENKSFAISRTIIDNRVWIFSNNSVYLGVSSDKELSAIALAIITLHHYSNDISYNDRLVSVSHSSSENVDISNLYARLHARKIVATIADKQPISYDIPHINEDFDYINLKLSFTRQSAAYFYSFRIYHDGDTILPTAILFRGNQPILEFDLNEEEIEIVSSIKEIALF